MRTIWKFDLPVTDVQQVPMPEGAILLHVGLQRENVGNYRTVTLWASVETTAPLVARRFAIVGTGNPAPEPDEAVFVGTVIDGPFVWHVFTEPSQITGEG